MIVLGVDPGARSGAYCVYDTNSHYCVVGDLPVSKDGVNGAEFARIVRKENPDVAVVERVNAFPGQGVSSVWSFARSYGVLLGVLAACEIPVELYTPTTWKKHYHLPGKDKNAARQKAIEMFPMVAGLNLKKHHGRAEALLLAHYHVLKRG